MVKNKDYVIDYETMLELTALVNDPIRTSSVIGTGNGEWSDRVGDICQLKELLDRVTDTR